jgi:thioredoxin reductase (NADPH)
VQQGTLQLGSNTAFSSSADDLNLRSGFTASNTTAAILDLNGFNANVTGFINLGGGNSAVDAALDMYRAGAHVTMVHVGATLDNGVKPWVRPDIEARIHEGSIAAHYESRVIAIEPDVVVVAGPDGEVRVPATQVYTMTGYLPETGLLEAVGVPIEPVSGIPAHNPLTMATPVTGVYLAGVIASGRSATRIFIENGRDHGDAIVRHILS